MENFIMTERTRLWLKYALGLVARAEGMEYEEKQRAFVLAGEKYASLEKKEKIQVRTYIRDELGDWDALTFYSYFAVHTGKCEFWNEIIYIIIKGSFNCYYGAM